MDRMIRMMIGPAMRMLTQWIARRGGNTAPDGQKQQNQATARKMNQTMRLIRRIGRF